MRFLGKRPARPGAVKLRFGDYAAPAALPVPPAAFGHYGQGSGLAWGMLANDRCGDCVWAGAAHETMLWTHRTGSGDPAAFTEDAVLSDYAAVTGYDRARPDTDQGTDMQEAASYRRRIGVIDAAGRRHKIESYVALRTGDCHQLALAAHLFGAVGAGLQLPDTAEHQFDAGLPWTVQPGARAAGGHYVSVVGRNTSGNFIVVTWGRLHAMSPGFYQKYNDETIAHLTTENLRDGASPDGFDVAQLRQDLSLVAASKS